jgi:hypothetical protein
MRPLSLIFVVLCGPALACNAGLPEAAEAPAALPALMAPPRAGFNPVADALVATCGTLDCHGQPGRNLRLYGSQGLRLSPKDDPGSAPTSAAERDANYWSVIGLEPETIDLVARARGAAPERLSLIRKARGTEKHKGGTLSQPGDAFDQCLLAWLASAPVEGPCTAAIPRRPAGK